MPVVRLAVLRAAALSGALGLTGCGVHLLTEGEPDFNTASLLPRQPHDCAIDAKASACAGRSSVASVDSPGPMPEVDAVPSGRTPQHGLFYRTFIAWADPTSVTPRGDVVAGTTGTVATPSGLTTLHIPQSCSLADRYDTAKIAPPANPPAPAPAPAPAPGAAPAAAGAAAPGAGHAAVAPANTTPHSAGYPYVKACFFAMKSLIDDNYREYAITLLHAVSTGHLASDLTVQALNGAATVSGGASAKAVLSAISSGVNAARGFIDEDVLYSQSIAIVMDRMDADRSRIAAVTTQAIAEEDESDPYSVSQAYNALLDYFWAGTFTHALESLKATTGAAKVSCKTASLQAQLKPNSSGATKPAGSSKNTGGTAAASSPDCGSSDGTDKTSDNGTNAPSK